MALKLLRLVKFQVGQIGLRLLEDKDSLVRENYYVRETGDFCYFNPPQCSHRIIEQ
jgi:hypothetical protein